MQVVSARPLAPRRRPPRGAFTMIELMVATVVFMLAIFGALSTQLASKRLIDESLETELATELARARMSEVMFLSVADIAAGQGAARVERDNGQPSIGGLENANLVFSTPGFVPGTPVPDTIVVRIDLTWTASRGQQRTLILRSAQG